MEIVEWESRPKLLPSLPSLPPKPYQIVMLRDDERLMFIVGGANSQREALAKIHNLDAAKSRVGLEDWTFAYRETPREEFTLEDARELRKKQRKYYRSANVPAWQSGVEQRIREWRRQNGHIL